MHYPTPDAAVAYGVSFALVVVLLASGCADASRGSCLAGEPRPIFRAGDSTVLHHDFRADGQASTETVAFDDGLLLAVEQSGCDTLIQAFTFAHDGLSDNFAAFLPEAVSVFYRLASLSPRLEAFAAYARLLTDVPASGREGAPVDLAPGLTLRISGLPTPNRPSWRVRFTQDLSAARSPR